MDKADTLIKQNPKLIYPVKYSGQVLYNVLLKTHEKMVVNNMIVETLDPDNVVARLYSKKCSSAKREFLIKTFNHYAITNSSSDLDLLIKHLN
jgi:hypothetical protein